MVVSMIWVSVVRWRMRLPVVVGGFISIEVGVGVGISAGSAHLDCDDVLSAYGGAPGEVVNVAEEDTRFDSDTVLGIYGVALGESVNVDEEVGVNVGSGLSEVDIVVGVGVGISAGSAHFDSGDAVGVYGDASGERVSVGEEVVLKVGADARKFGIVVDVRPP